MVINTFSWKSIQNLVVWEIGKKYLRNKMIIWEDQIRGWILSGYQDQKIKQEANGKV